MAGRATSLKRRVSGAVCVAIGACALASPAQAATVVGQTNASVANCSTGDNGQVQASTAGPPDYVIPSNGVITSFTAGAGNAPETTVLLILQRLSGNTYDVVAKQAGTFPDAGLETFAAQIPVQTGQYIGNWGEVCGNTTVNGGDVLHSFAGPEPAVGFDQPFTSATTSFRANLSATLEPDCDGDGRGDETQDTDLTSCQPPPAETPATPKTSRAVSLDANKGKVKKGKKLTFFGSVDANQNEAACEAGQAIELQVSSGGTFETFEVTSTDSQGGYQATLKVKKSGSYRARVAETAACTAADSAATEIKVKKKKKK